MRSASHRGTPPHRDWAQRLVGYAVARPKRLLLGALLLVVASGVSMARLRVSRDLRQLMPSDSPAIQRLEQASAQAGNQSDLIVVVRSPDRAANRAFGRALAAALRRHRGLRWVVFRRELEFFRRHALLYLPLDELLGLRQRVIDRIRKEVARRVVVDLEDDDEPQRDSEATRFDPERALERYLGGSQLPTEYMEADEGRLLLLVARPRAATTDVAAAGAVVEDVRQAIARLHPSRFHPELRAELRGHYLEMLGEVRGVGAGIISAAVFAVSLLLAVIIGFFRSLRAGPLVVLPVIAATVVTLGIGAAIYTTFNLVTTFIFAILLGFGIDFAIHALARYRAERRRGLDLEPALQRAVGSTGRALLVSAVTTGAAFALLALGRFRGFAQFGVVAAIGVACAFAATLALLPPLIVLFERWRPERFGRPRPAGSPPGGPSTAGGGSKRSLALSGAVAWGVVFVSVALAGLSLWHAGEVGFEYDFTKLGRPHRPSPPKASRSAGGEAESGHREVNFRAAMSHVSTYGKAVVACRDRAQCREVTVLVGSLMRLHDRQRWEQYRAVRRGEVLPASSDGVSGRAGGVAESRARRDERFAAMQHRLGPAGFTPHQRALLDAIGLSRLDEMRRLLRGYLSFQAFIPLDQEDKLAIIRDIRRRIDAKRSRLSADSRAELQRWYRYLLVPGPVTERSLPGWVRDELREPDGQLGRYAVIWNEGVKANYHDAKRLHEAYFDLPLRGDAAPAAANYFVLAEVIDSLKADGPVVMGAAACAVLLCLLATYRSLRAALLVLAPLVISLGWLAGVYELMDWKLNIFSVVAFPLLIGLSIDDGIHLYHRWRETHCLRTVLREIGGPITMTTLTTFIGFAGLIFADHVGVQSLGLTAGLGVWLTLLGSVATLSALLYALDRRQPPSGSLVVRSSRGRLSRPRPTARR